MQFTVHCTFLESNHRKHVINKRLSLDLATSARISVIDYDIERIITDFVVSLSDLGPNFFPLAIKYGEMLQCFYKAFYTVKK